MGVTLGLAAAFVIQGIHLQLHIIGKEITFLKQMGPDWKKVENNGCGHHRDILNFYQPSPALLPAASDITKGSALSSLFGLLSTLDISLAKAFR